MQGACSFVRRWYNTDMAINDTTGGRTMKTKTKTQFVVMVNGEEVSRHARRKIAESAAAYVGGMVIEYRKEWQE